MAPPEDSPSRSFLIRLTSAVAVAVPCLAAIHAGFPYFDALLVVMVTALAWEWAILCSEGRRQIASIGSMLLSCWAVTGLAIWGSHPGALILVAIGAALTYVTGRAGGLPNVGLRALGVCYVAVPGVAVLWLRYAVPDGGLTVMWMVVAVAATDTGAFLAGRSFGGPRLAPRISPGKTWSGLVGGLVSAALVGAVSALALGGRTPAGMGVWVLAVASAAVALVSQAGDLVESAAKRRFGVKDMGAIIPGHGGAFDRLDGHLAAAVGVAVFGLILGGERLSWR